MIVLDIETTGLDPQKHAVLSIGAVDFLQPTRTFYVECFVHDGAQVSDEALHINGFSREQIMIRDKP